MSSTQPGQRRTTQRQSILDVFHAAPGPLKVKDILEQAKAGSPNLGIATVYRTIKLLLEANQVKAVTLPDGEARYEIVDKEHHCHFRCRTCGQVLDLIMCAVSIPEGRLPAGFNVEWHDLTLHGTCPECSATAEADAGST